MPVKGGCIMYEINQRVLEVRKALRPKMTQTEFGEALGVSRSVIANIEMNRVAQPTEQFLRLLCRTFSVSYGWLKAGVGKMFLDETSPDLQFERIMSGEDEFTKSVMRAMLSLGDEEWEALKKVVEKLKAGAL